MAIETQKMNAMLRLLQLWTLGLGFAIMAIASMRMLIFFCGQDDSGVPVTVAEHTPPAISESRHAPLLANEGLAASGIFLVAMSVALRFLREGGIQKAADQRLAVIAQYTTNAVISFNSRQQVDWISDGYTRMTGYELHESSENPQFNCCSTIERKRPTAIYFNRKSMMGLPSLPRF